jgi:chromosome segregation ATPase
MKQIKEEILKLLETDKEFRYAVAGYLGLSEIMKRLDSIAEEQVRLREEQIKTTKELANLREEQIKLREEQTMMRDEQIKLTEEQIKLREDMNKGFSRRDEELAKLREDFNEMLKEIRSINLRLNRVERTLEKLTVDIEEEARSIISYRIEKELGLEVKIGSLILPDLELNIYACSNDTCIVGEASVRASANLVDEIMKKIDTLRRNYPGMLRKNVIPVIYCSLAMPELVDEAKKRKIWVLKATEDIVKLDALINYSPS